MKNKHLKNIGVSMLLAAVFVVIFPTAKGDRYEALQQKQLELNRIEEDFLEYQDQLRSEFFFGKGRKSREAHQNPKSDRIRTARV
jgi:hypothetical protein